MSRGFRRRAGQYNSVKNGVFRLRGSFSGPCRDAQLLSTNTDFACTQTFCGASLCSMPATRANAKASKPLRAARAGISVGTLYSHFASKESILVSMACKLLADAEAEVVRAVCGGDHDESSPVRSAVRTVINLHRFRSPVRRVVMNAHTSHGLSHERSAVVHSAAQRILVRR